MKIFKWLGLAIVCAAAMGAAPSKAATIYTYTGNQFTADEITPGGAYSTLDRVSGWFELASPLGDGTAGIDISSNVVAFSFSDGVQTLVNGGDFNNVDGFALFFVGTDSSGVPNEWIIGIIDNLAGVGIVTCSFTTTGGEGLSNCAGGGPHDAGGSQGSAGVFNDPGTWTVTTTPLPAALPLFASGLGALGLLGWRRKRKDRTAIAA
jgi:hypothetical protein